MNTNLTRRGFLATAAGVSFLTAGWPAVLRVAQAAGAARASGAGFGLLDEAQAADFAAIASQIIPGGDSPGASEAGVVYFIDQALRGFMAGAAPGLLDGLKALNEKAGQRFATLDGDAQRKLLGQAQESEFFETVHFLTVAGMFAMPAYGGNRDRAGWKLLGFEGAHANAPPFGYYDAEAAGSGGKT